ncbi:MAG: chemotaxis protein CheA [Polaromonas sp.]|uniref:chemotaxis protein CheA n=1 Tax=Polaromonas sp. TaxID=1869339 RepID=UPI0025D553EB|nr:chemotaxis protein CheA [Polaromonas sp.]MBI2725520.1 chemotaxis protein CheA [Polaromonas sp.]
MNLDQALLIFIAESRELLEDMESSLLSLEAADEKTELINSIFRAAHTIKGSSGLFSLDHVVAFTHVVENVLDRVRSGTLTIGDDLIATLLLCCDHIKSLIDGVEKGQTEADAASTEAGAPLLLQLHAVLGASASAKGALVAEPEIDATQRIAGKGSGSDYWHISLQFSPEVLRLGMDPLSFLRYLNTMGHIVDILTLPDKLPDAASMEPEACYLAFELEFDSSADKASIERAFEFVRDDCTLRIVPPNSRVEEYIRLIKDSPDIAERIGELLVRSGALTRQELAAALDIQADSVPGRQIGAILVEQQAVPSEVVDAALQKQKQVKEVQAQESRSIRVDADKLDHLINLVGELIIAGASVNMIAHRAKVIELEEATSKLSSLVEEVRDSALQLRMVKIGATFSRFQRVVHDVSRDLGKDIALIIDGEETELDKTVVEKIGDPLMHLVRNSMDHGIENAELRQARGKPAQGVVKLNAYHDSGAIVITVQDDGGGLKRDRILAKAVERGLVEAGQHLSDSEVYGLIFEPGFSTAEQITNLSGRGVGLDVVKRNIAALRGTVGLTSQEGVGTTVTVRLPLTLAIIDGFLVEVGKRVFAIPLDMIEECVAFTAEPGHDYTNLRGQILPFIRLRELFSIQAAPPVKGENIVVLKYAGQKAGLVVDTLLGEFQTVIKPLGPVFSHVACLSGSTILGSGDVALILDVPQLIRRATGGQPSGLSSVALKSETRIS